MQKPFQKSKKSPSHEIQKVKCGEENVKKCTSRSFFLFGYAVLPKSETRVLDLTTTADALLPLRVRRDEEIMNRLCDYCSSATAEIFCRADSARLCLACDRQVRFEFHGKK